MFDILTLNKISQIGLKELDEKYNITDNCDAPDGIIVRSAAMHDYNFNEKTLAVARAGAGVNNIPVDECTKKGVVVFNTPGANANAVKELVLCGMLLACRDITGGIDWVKTQTENADVAKTAEKEKKHFAKIKRHQRKWYKALVWLRYLPNRALRWGLGDDRVDAIKRKLKNR